MSLVVLCFTELLCGLFQGDIASCAGVALHLWNINGEPLARLSPRVSTGATISCCCFIEVMDWDIHSLIVTGDTTGSVQVGPSRRGLPLPNTVVL